MSRVAAVPGALVSLAALLILPAAAAAHRLAPSLLELREIGAGRFDVHWKTPRLQSAGAPLLPELPGTCRSLAEPLPSADASSLSLRWTVDCGTAGLLGETLRVSGLELSGTSALIRVSLADGRRLRGLLDGDRPSLEVTAREQPLRVVRETGALGLRHILGGPDHLLFVTGLMLLVRGRRRLLATITAFTLGHSVTLALAVLGFVRFPSGAVELAIALSLLLLAAEIARGSASRGGRMRRRPWVMASGFGLLHGLGFAGALTEAGLPADEIPLALASFNVGIELGQLVFVALMLALGGALAALPVRSTAWLTRAPAYAIGILAAYWCFDRAALLF
jgi:hypothetical protein